MSNLKEISDMLDGDVYNSIQLEDNYTSLVKKYGEWKIAGKKGSLVTFRTIDYRKAIFSGLSKTYLIVAVISFASAIVFGKVLFPVLSSMYKNQNEELVDLSTLRTAETVNVLAGQENKNTRTKKEWF